MSDVPKLGKNIMDNLAYSMYLDLRVLYREYIQNAADAIDAAVESGKFTNSDMEINIKIDPIKRYISIEDNALGISKDFVPQKLETIADSDKKKDDNRGFRGIGRLCGLAVCKELRFVTTAMGEDTQTTMVWKAEDMMRKVHDDNYHENLSMLLSNTISYEYTKCDKDKHFFRVEMLDVKESRVLDVEKIKVYLKEVAPVDYWQTFIFRSKIEQFLLDKKDDVGELKVYNIFVNDEDIYKEYPTRIYTVKNNRRGKDEVDSVKDVFADIIRDQNGKTIAWIWYSITKFNGVINKVGNPMHWMRIRHKNIEIGDENTCINFNYFKEDKGSKYFFGEIHVLDEDLRPNARRDYFDRTEALDNFENTMRAYIAQNLDTLYRIGSKLNSRYRDIEEYKATKKKIEDIEKHRTTATSPKEEAKLRKQLDEQESKAKSATTTVNNILEKAKEREGSSFTRAVNVIQDEHSNVDVDATKDSIEKRNKKEQKQANDTQHKKNTKPDLLADELTYLDKKSRKIITRIYEIISDNLSPDESKDLIMKIQKGLEQKKKNES